MLQRGDIVEHQRGRWKGRRLTVIGLTRLGAADVVDSNSNHSTILQPENLLRVVGHAPLLDTAQRDLNMSAILDAIIEHRDFSYWPYALHLRVTRRHPVMAT